jgi:hypothetical protein
MAPDPSRSRASSPMAGRHSPTASRGLIEIRHAFGTEELAAAHLVFADGHANPATGLIFTL